MNPINYMQQQPDLGADFAQGIQLGNAIRQQRLVRQQEQEAEQFKVELDTALKGNDPRAFISLQAKYPKYGAGIKQTWDALSEEQRGAELLPVLQTFSALQSNRPDVALGVVDEHITAMRNSGRDPSKLLGIRSMMERDPAMASNYVASVLSAVAPKEFADNLSKIGKERRDEQLQPGAMREQSGRITKQAGEIALQTPALRRAEAEAETAAVAARFAESNAVKDLEKKGWDITKIQNDIDVSKENSRIAAMNAAINRENNAIKREELKLKRDEAAQKRDETLRGKVSEAESARFNIDNFLNTTDRILATPMSVIGSAAGPVSARLPTLTQATADFEGLIENIDAQGFLAQIPQMKGMGALSNAEGAKLSAALQNFNLRQSPERIVENAREVQRLMLKARKAIATKYGIPDTVPDTPAAAKATSPQEADDLVRKYLNAPRVKQ